MHQILGLRDYTDKDGKLRKAEKFFEKGWRFTEISDLFKDPIHYIEMIPESERHGLYYTMSECLDEPGRKFKSQKYLPFDIDDIDTTKEEETAKAALAALGLDWFKTGVLASGNGLQFIVRTHEPFEDPLYFENRRDDYRACCSKINNALRKANLKGEADPSVWSPARLMRMPLTWNRKPNKPERMARILQNNIEPVMFDFKKAAGIPEISREDFIVRYPPPDTKAVLEGCEQLKSMLTEPDTISEPEWYAGLSILARLGESPVEGREIAHTYSKAYKGYSQSDTDTKIDQALKASGPRTCASFRQYNDKCLKCKYQGKVKSAILIQGDEFIATKATRFHFTKTTTNGTLTVGNPDYAGLVKWFKKQFMYKVANDTTQLYVFNGDIYHSINDLELKKFATENFTNELSTKHKVSEFIHLIKSQPHHGVSREWFSESTEGKIKFSNGVYDVKTKQLLPASEEYGFLNSLDYAYDPEAKAPRFERFLSEVTLDRPDLIKTLLEFCGYCFSNDDYWEHKALFIFGKGSNGKSVFIDLLKAMGGSLCSSVSMGKITNEIYTRLLFGKLFNLSEEGSAEGFRNSDVFKKLSSGGEVEARELYQNPFMFRNKAKLVFASNELPPSSDASEGYYRRFLFAPFEADFSQIGKADKFLIKKLVEERAGIFNIFIRAYEDMKDRGYCYISTESSEELEDYRIDTDSVRRWFQENVERGDDKDIISRSEFYKKYRAWAKEEDIQAKSLRSFSTVFRTHITTKGARLFKDSEGIMKVQGLRFPEKPYRF